MIPCQFINTIIFFFFSEEGHRTLFSKLHRKQFQLFSRIDVPFTALFCMNFSTFSHAPHFEDTNSKSGAAGSKCTWSEAEVILSISPSSKEARPGRKLTSAQGSQSFNRTVHVCPHVVFCGRATLQGPKGRICLHGLPRVGYEN